ncbi:hypothetical protein KAK07_24570 [Ideonella sp. 4Y16]|uniref:YEATS-associated helix-containing protein n=1 Tax=Ideonella alba TaxID=2824118 RepID=UPI001B365A58|nr:YEATS-associated helix-containing protein [Ideonella alba]MBQ0946529.1 hypothetical protein [Ideonella alba]
MANLIALLVILLLAGVLGGAMGYYLEQSGQPSKTEGDGRGSARIAQLVPYIVLGIGASLMVPLFLNMISSTLVSEALNSKEGEHAELKLLVITGFSLIAAASSRRFITSLTDKVIRDVQEAKEIAQEVEKKVDLIVEPENAPREPSGPANMDVQVNLTDLSDHEKRVLKTLFNSSYSARALSGISRDGEISQDEATSALKLLASKSLVHQTQTFKGFAKWSLTQAGRSAAGAI